MKTLFKIIFGLLFIVLFLVGFVFFTLSNEGMMNRVTSFALEKSGLDIKYGSLKGNLFDGLEIKDFNYENSIKADLKLDADFKKLQSGVLHIKDIEVTNLFIDEEFLKTLGSSDEKKEEKNSESAIKKVIVDHAKLNLIDFKYEDYYVQKLDLDIDNLKYDMDKDIQGDIKADLLSNIIDAKLNANINGEKYKAHLDGKPKDEFINTFTKEQNLTVNEAPNIVLDANGTFDLVNAHLVLNGGELKYQDIQISPKSIDLVTKHNIKNGDNESDLKALIDSNVAYIDLKNISKVNINDINNTLFFDLDTKIDPKKGYLKVDKLTVDKLPKLHIKASGDFDDIKLKILTDEGRFVYNKIAISSKVSKILANYSLNSGDLKADIDTVVNSDMADFDLVGDILLNAKDINNTLKIDLSSNLKPKSKQFKAKLDENNISIKKMPKIALELKGDFKKLNLLAKVGKGDIKYNNYHISPQNIDIDAFYSLKSGDLSANAQADIDTNIADLDLTLDTTLNSKDINSTLKFNTNAKIIATPRELKEFNLTITKPTHITLKSKGNMDNIKSILNVRGEVLYQKIKIKPKIYNTKVDFSPKTNELDAVLFADIFSSIAKLKTKAKVKLDLDDLNNTLFFNGDILLTDTKPYKGVDLRTLTDLKIKAVGSLKKLDAKIDSPKIQATAKSRDFDLFDIKLDTKKVDIGKIYRYLPKELQKSFINIKSDGFYRLSKNEAKFHTKLRGFKYGDKVISTDEFDFEMRGEDITLSGFHLKANGFDMAIEAKKIGDTIKAKINNASIKADANIKLNPLSVNGYAKIDSIKKFVTEINKVYPLKLPMNIDGSLDLKAKMQDDSSKITLISPKIEFDDGNLVDLNIMALYNPDKVVIKNFDFFLKDFEPKEFNRKVNLKKDGIIVLTEGKTSIDFELENLLKFKAKQDGDVLAGKLNTDRLLLSYKDYGMTKLTTNLDMYQVKDKIVVTGFIEVKDTDITYESSYLDVSKDPDIIVITREDKGKKEENNFKKNIFLDIDIRSKNEIIYKVPAGEVELKPNMNIRKDFEQDPKITGKLKILDGYYDVAGKRFLLKESAVAFRGQEKVNPLLDIAVEYDEVDDILIKIAVGGDKNRPKLNFTSEPMMSKKDILSALLFGFVVSESEGASSSANKAAEAIFGRAIAQDLARELNLDRLDLNRNDIGGIDVKAGKKINRKSIIYYKNKLNESSVIYEKKLDKKWSIESEVGKQGYGLDLFFRKGYK